MCNIYKENFGKFCQKSCKTKRKDLDLEKWIF
nr:MAG TPA: DNA gyrase inhibitor [Bacteriophage sp.]